MMKIGAHVRLGKGLLNAVELAEKAGCETMQIFAANPNAWTSRSIDPSTADEFHRRTLDAGIGPVCIHTPYLLNLASPVEDNYSKSTTALVDSIQRAEVLHADFVVTHIGSHRGTSFEDSLSRIESAVRSAVCETGNAVLLLENSSGSGDSVGAKFEELSAILSRLSDCRSKVGICLDTAHLWGAGYDLSDPDSINGVVSDFDSIVGLSWLKLLHLNDTKVPLGSRKDRHANIGTGSIGEDGFNVLLHHPALADLAGIIETPPRSDDKHDIDILKHLRDNG
ncbi:MAG: deoxyribonuclease IV [Armatimonadota bacterium]